MNVRRWFCRSPFSFRLWQLFLCILMLLAAARAGELLILSTFPSPSMTDSSSVSHALSPRAVNLRLRSGVDINGGGAAYWRTTASPTYKTPFHLLSEAVERYSFKQYNTAQPPPPPPGFGGVVQVAPGPQYNAGNNTGNNSPLNKTDFSMEWLRWSTKAVPTIDAAAFVQEVIAAADGAIDDIDETTSSPLPFRLLLVVKLPPFYSHAVFYARHRMWLRDLQSVAQVHVASTYSEFTIGSQERGAVYSQSSAECIAADMLAAAPSDVRAAIMLDHQSFMSADSVRQIVWSVWRHVRGVVRAASENQQPQAVRIPLLTVLTPTASSKLSMTDNGECVSEQVVVLRPSGWPQWSGDCSARHLRPMFSKSGEFLARANPFLFTRAPSSTPTTIDEQGNDDDDEEEDEEVEDDDDDDEDDDDDYYLEMEEEEEDLNDEFAWKFIRLARPWCGVAVQLVHFTHSLSMITHVQLPIDAVRCRLDLLTRRQHCLSVGPLLPTRPHQYEYVRHVFSPLATATSVIDDGYCEVGIGVFHSTSMAQRQIVRETWIKVARAIRGVRVVFVVPSEAEVEDELIDYGDIVRLSDVLAFFKWAVSTNHSPTTLNFHRCKVLIKVHAETYIRPLQLLEFLHESKALGEHVPLDVTRAMYGFTHGEWAVKVDPVVEKKKLQMALQTPATASLVSSLLMPPLGVYAGVLIAASRNMHMHGACFCLTRALAEWIVRESVLSKGRKENIREHDDDGIDRMIEVAASRRVGAVRYASGAARVGGAGVVGDCGEAMHSSMQNWYDSDVQNGLRSLSSVFCAQQQH